MCAVPGVRQLSANSKIRQHFANFGRRYLNTFIQMLSISNKCICTNVSLK
jgi:hypothetical protein